MSFFAARMFIKRIIGDSKRIERIVVPDIGQLATTGVAREAACKTRI